MYILVVVFNLVCPTKSGLQKTAFCSVCSVYIATSGQQQMDKPKVEVESVDRQERV